ncbi:MFS transporter [Streptomyces cacaoi]|uniref:MFS transporter n=1 Tax=Streptomyces cacaoi TaxID=1898 RepID=UPI0011F2E40E|nr:MFS transporter [Streptomyces cacaoi]
MGAFDEGDTGGARTAGAGPKPRGAGDGAAGPEAKARAAVEAQAADGAGGARKETALSRPHRALTLGIVSVVLLIAFEATAVGTAMPVAADELNGIGLYPYAFSAFFTTSVVGMVASGQWCDRRGPLPPLMTGIGAFAGGLVLSGTAVSMWIFVLGRAVQGIGGGLVIVSLYVTVSRAFPASVRPKVLAAFAASWVVPSVVGPLISGTVTQQLGWRWVFLGIPVLVVLPLVVMLPPLRRKASGPPPGAGERSAESAEEDRRRIRLAIAVAVGAGLLQYASQDLRLVALVPAAAGLALLVPSVRALLPRGTLRAARGLPTVVLLRGMAAGSYIVAESFVPLMLVTQRGLSVTMAGLTLAAGGASWALGSFVQSRPGMDDRRQSLARFGMVFVTFSLVYAPVVLVPSVPVWTLAAGMAVGCFGMGLVISSLSVLLLQLSAPEETGRNSAALQLCDGLSNVLLLAATGAVFTSLGGGSVTVGAGHTAQGADGGQPSAFVAVYAVSAVVAFGGVLVAGRLRPKEPSAA